jgi:hypothetical protein
MFDASGRFAPRRPYGQDSRASAAKISLILGRSSNERPSVKVFGGQHGAISSPAAALRPSLTCGPSVSPLASVLPAQISTPHRILTGFA